MMNKRTTCLGGFLLVLIIATQAVSGQQVSRPRPGQPGTWRVIGTTHASFSADHDAIVVKGPGDNFSKIKIKVTDAPLNLLRLVVTYDNGEPEKIETRFNIPKGGESRVIDLRGGSRSLKRIDFWYDTKGILKGTADVTVFGMK